MHRRGFLCRLITKTENAATMTTLTIQIENPTIIPSLRKVLGAMEGVSIVKPARKSRAKAASADIPNAETIAAMRESESGHDAGAVNLDSLEKFVSSMC